MKNFFLAENGYSIIPVKSSKAPLGSWKKNETEAFGIETLKNKCKNPEAVYLGLVCGYNNVEVIDVDLKFILTETARLQFWENLLSELDNNVEDFYNKVVIVQTKSGGYHIIYRNEKREFCNGNLKLAKPPGYKETIIETRGEGGQIVIYEIEGNDYSKLVDLKTISKRDKDIIFAVCKSFDEVKPETIVVSNFKKVSTWSGGLKPWDDYNNKTNVLDLIKNDFKIVGENAKYIKVLRNGSEAAHSGYVFKDTNSLYLFTSNAAPLPPNEKLTPFKVFCLYEKLEYTDGAKKLLELGYGEKGVSSTKKKRAEITDYNKVEIVTNEEPNEEAETIHRISYWIKNHVKLKFNEVTKKIVFAADNEKLTEAKSKTLFLHAKLIDPKINREVFECIITGHNPEIIPIFNPFKEFIEANKDISTSNELQTLQECISSNTLNANLWVKKWYLGLFAAIDGKPVRNVLTLLGGQNSGKSEFFRRLLPNELMEYYGESKLDRGKDDELLMCEKLIINDDEMGGKSKQDEKLFKELSSKAIFSLRVPYGRGNEDFKRLSVLCGTSNDLQVLNDATGNTRILGVEVLAIDHEKYNSIDKTKLFIDGYRAYLKDKNSYLLTREELKLLEASGESFKAISIEEELIIRYIKPSYDKDAEFMTSSEIKEYLEYKTSYVLDEATGLRYSKPGTKIVNIKLFGIYLKKHLGEQIKQWCPKRGNSVRVYAIQKLEKLENVDEVRF